MTKDEREFRWVLIGGWCLIVLVCSGVLALVPPMAGNTPMTGLGYWGRVGKLLEGYGIVTGSYGAMWWIVERWRPR